jgi:hypothetical protein
MQCPCCYSRIPYRRALVRRTAQKPIRCTECGSLLKCKRSLVSYALAAVSLVIGCALHNRPIFWPLLFVLDLTVDRLTVKLVVQEETTRALEMEIQTKEKLGATLISKSRLRRRLEVRIDPDVFYVEYNGAGIGYEEVLVGGELAVRRSSWAWYVPRFEFALGPYAAVIEVHIGPWLSVRGFLLEVEGVLLYAEGTLQDA